MKVKTVKSFDAKAATILVVEWKDGKSSQYDIADLEPAIVAQLAWHGLKQKTMDAHAAVMSEGGTIADCRTASDAVFEGLCAGDWSTGRANAPWILEALADLFDLDEDEARAKWEALDEATQKKVRKDPKVKAWKARKDLEAAEKAQAAAAEAGDIGGLFATGAEE